MDMDPIAFIHQLSYDDLSLQTVQSIKRLLIDNLGVCITGRQTKLTQIVYDYAATIFAGNDTRLWLDGRQVSLPGAVLAHAYACDSVDMHDGFARSDGHPGAAVIPAVFALLYSNDGSVIDGKELLTTAVVAYEISIRAGAVLHATSRMHHSSGAWNALGVAAAYARRFNLTRDQTRHALGFAEYNGPRSLIMRCVDYPTMVKDGSGWGAMTGMSAAILAKMGFTAAPATTVEVHTDEKNRNVTVAREEWQDLGNVWSLENPRIKQHAVCFWSLAPIYATLALRERHKFTNDDIAKIKVLTFEKATHLNHPSPQNTEQAQYSLPFGVAAVLVHGQVTAKEIDGEQLKNEHVLRLSQIVELIVDEQMSIDYYKGRCACRVTVITRDGRKFTLEDTVNAWSSPTNEELDSKFRTNAEQCLPADQVSELLDHLWNIENVSSVHVFDRLLQKVEDL